MEAETENFETQYKQNIFFYREWNPIASLWYCKLMEK